MNKRLRKQDRIDLRRNRVNELYSQGCNQSEIARILSVGLGTVNRDISCFRNQAKDAMKMHVSERIPEEYQKCLTGLNSLLKEAWTSLPETQNMAEKIKVLTLALEIYVKKITFLADPYLLNSSVKEKSISKEETENEDIQTLEKEDNESRDPDIVNGVF